MQAQLAQQPQQVVPAPAPAPTPAPPSPPTGTGGAEGFVQMIGRIASMDDAQLQSMLNTGFGALALAEISKRNRDRMMAQAQSAQQGPTGTIADQEIAKLMQAKMRDRLASDDRLGLNNIVAQAEGGGLEFGQPMGGQASIGESEGAMPMGAGGGVVAFKNGGDVPGYAAGALIGALGRATPIMGRAVGRGIKALRERNVGLGTAATLATPFGFLGGGEERGPTDTVRSRDADYPDETRRGSAQYVAEGLKIPERYGSVSRDVVPAIGDEEGGQASSADRTGIAGLQAPQPETDARRILADEDALLAEQGLGEYGAKVRESIAGRRGKAEEMYGRAMGSEPLLAAAEAAGGGGKRMSGLQALASAVGAAGKSAAGIRREEREAIDKITEGEEKLMLAEDLYKRGRVSDAQKMGREAQQQIFNNQVKMQELKNQERGLQIREEYNAILGKQAAAKTSGLPPALQVEFYKQFGALRESLNSKAIDEATYRAGIADIQRQIQEAYVLNSLGNIEIGTR
jgi:hypothetical protein